MALPNLCQRAFALLRQIEPIIVLQQLGSAFFDTALQLVVKDRCANATYPGLPAEESRQKAMTDFYMTYHLIVGLVPILPALLLGKLSDRGWRRAPIVVSLGGYLLSRVALLVVVVYSLPLTVMFGALALFELTGGFSAYWPGVMTLASLGSTATDRSKVMMRVELLYGAAGLVGSLLSGHLFLVSSSGVGQGVVLIFLSTLLHLLILLHSIFLLQVNEVSSSESRHILPPAPDDDNDDYGVVAAGESPGGECPARINTVNVVLLFATACLYDFAVGGAMSILPVFVMKEPLSWSAAQVGYGNAAGFTIFLTSFLAVILFRRCGVSDVALVMIGMLSFASGIYFMSFVTATYMYYLARSLTLFALIPTPIIRSLLSQQVPSTSYGTILTSLQLAMKMTGLAYIPTFTKIYQGTLGWFPGFVFTLASVFTVLGVIPVSIVGYRSPPRRRWMSILGN